MCLSPIRTAIALTAAALALSAAISSPAQARPAGPVLSVPAGRPTESAAVVAATPNPSTSPAPRSISPWSGELLAPKMADSCASGLVCAWVKLPSGKYEVFKFYTYGTYYLSYFKGFGAIVNKQTGGASVKTYKQDGSVAFYIHGDDHGVEPPSSSQQWDPVWKLSLIKG